MGGHLILVFVDTESKIKQCRKKNPILMNFPPPFIKQVSESRWKPFPTSPFLKPLQKNLL